MRTLTAIVATLALALQISPVSAKPRNHRAKADTSEVDSAKRQLSVAKHHAKITKLAAKVAEAIEACELEVSIACEDTTERDHDAGECSDETLRASHAFDVCTGHGPAFVAEGK